VGEAHGRGAVVPAAEIPYENVKQKERRELIIVDEPCSSEE